MHRQAIAELAGGAVRNQPLAEAFEGATTWLMWRKGRVGANLNAWIEVQQAVYPAALAETRETT
ncbi:hypothetical protein [Pseudomonas sp. NPDC087615]|uniref:hypothetical protein n=1 Tax=Pseudomonas sp. NPDC087615 TaxID=3364443 RepID=UPI00382712D9